MHGSLYMNLKSTFPFSFPFFLWCPMKQKAKLQHTTSAEQKCSYPQTVLWLISEKNDGQKLQMNSQRIMDKRVNLFVIDSHLYIYVPLHQAVTKTPIRSIIFPTFRVINDKFCAQVWLSGHLWDTVLYFNGGILNACWITRIPLKNATR